MLETNITVYVNYNRKIRVKKNGAADVGVQERQAKHAETAGVATEGAFPTAR